MIPKRFFPIDDRKDKVTAAIEDESTAAGYLVLSRYAFRRYIDVRASYFIDARQALNVYRIGTVYGKRAIIRILCLIDDYYKFENIEKSRKRKQRIVKKYAETGDCQKYFCQIILKNGQERKIVEAVVSNYFLSRFTKKQQVKK